MLHEAFTENRLRTDIDFEALLQDGSPESQAYRMIQAMLQLARNQVLLRHELDIHSTQLIDHEKRIEFRTVAGAPAECSDGVAGRVPRDWRPLAWAYARRAGHRSIYVSDSHQGHN